MKRSPSLFSRIPPSPRTPSVMSTPAPATPVGWNCQNSMSSSGSPARAAMPQAVAGVDVRIGARRRRSGRPRRSRAPSTFDSKHHDLARLHFERNDTDDVAVGVADQVERHPFDEELGACPHVALVERVQQRVPGTVGGRARALDRLLTEIGRVAAERALVDRAVGIAVERHPEVLEFVDHLRCHPAHVLDRVLVAEIVRPLDRVEHVPVPVVLAHVAQRGADPALRGHGVRPGREHLREHRNLVAGLGQLQRTTHAGTAGADDDRIELAPREVVRQVVEDIDHLRLPRG